MCNWGVENVESSDETKLNERRAIMQTRVISWWKSGKWKWNQARGNVFLLRLRLICSPQSVCFIAFLFLYVRSGETMPEVGEKAAPGCQHKYVFYACRKRWHNGKKTPPLSRERPKKKRKYFLPFSRNRNYNKWCHGPFFHPTKNFPNNKKGKKKTYNCLAQNAHLIRERKSSKRNKLE